MQRATPLEDNGRSVADRGAGQPAPRSTPLTIVSRAVAGGDLQSIARSASEAIGRPVAIAIPSLGEPVVYPAGEIAPGDVSLISQQAVSLIRDQPADARPAREADSPAADARPARATEAPSAREADSPAADSPPAYATEAPASGADAVPVRIGREIVGLVAAAGAGGSPDDDPWLDAAAAAAAIAALMRHSREGDLRDSRRVLLQALGAGPPADLAGLLAHARRLGHDLSAGGVAIAAEVKPGCEPNLDELVAHQGGLMAVFGERRVVGLVPLASAIGTVAKPTAVATALRARGLHVVTSAPRRDPAALHEALREAELLVELGCDPVAPLSGHEETYRLLIGVLLRDPQQLEQLRTRTISPLATYDAQHDTELVATLQAFLAHHGSTTETAEAMSLHRHTVGYRLSRVHEVSGLSPYESDGRERLSLGLKAHQILAADEHRTARR